MRHALVFIFVAAVGSTVGVAISTAADPVKSGPEPGAVLPGPFHPLNINGPYAGNPHCLVCAFGLKPVVMIFARQTPDKDEALGKLLQKLDEATAKHQQAGLRCCAVVLSGDFAREEPRKALVNEFEAWAKTADLKSVVIALDNEAGPEKYHLSKEAGVTVVLYQHLKVVANLASAGAKLTDENARAILAAANKLGTLK